MGREVRVADNVLSGYVVHGQEVEDVSTVHRHCVSRTGTAPGAEARRRSGRECLRG